MGSPCAVCLAGGPADDLNVARDAILAEIARLERKYSRYRDESLTARINASAGSGTWLTLDAETAGLLDYAQTAFEQSGGRFDLSSGGLRQAWDFKSGRIPAQAEIDAALARVGWDKLEWAPPRLRLPVAGMALDFGGLVKEYAVDRAVQIARQHGVAHGWVDLGGDVGVIGPQLDGRPWRIGLRHPYQVEALSVLDVDQGAVASSGNYARKIDIDGKRYGHILDPRNGWPIAGAAAVSVLAANCLLAGTSATIAMLHGSGAEAWLDNLGLPYAWVDDAGQARGSLVPGVP